MILGDLGAEVIKVEPVTGDGMRMVNQPFMGCSRGKRDIGLNVKSERGKEIALQLVERADIVHHNMTAGVAERLGIAYEDCKRVNPDVVYCNTWAYGLEGPQAHFGGLDPIFQAAAGLEYEAGPVREGNKPLYIRFGMTDTANAMLSVVGCLAALYHQRRTGEGQELWTSLLDGAAMLSSDAMLVDGVAVPRPRLDADQSGSTRATGCTERSTKTGSRSPRSRRNSSQACVARSACPSWSTTRASRIGRGRHEHRHQLEALFAPVFATRTAIVWSRLLDDEGVPNEIPRDMNAGEAFLFDADHERLGLVAEYDHPIVGRMRQFGAVIDFSETPGRIAGPPPLVGEHTKDILGWLGYAEGQMQALKDEGVVYWPDDAYSWTV